MVTKDQVITAISTVIDPDLFLDIWFMGLIYDIVIIDETKVNIKMTLTSQLCPAGPYLIDQVKQRVGEIEGVTEVNVDLVFDPPWQPPDELKAYLGLM